MAKDPVPVTVFPAASPQSQESGILKSFASSLYMPVAGSGVARISTPANVWS